MFSRTCAAALSLLLAAPLAAQSDDAFVTWARGRAVPVDSYRSLDDGIRKARLIGVGESVHETEPFLSFRLQLLQDLVRRHRVTALVLESGLPEAMMVDDYVRGKTATIDFDAALPGGFGRLTEIRRTMEWLREWNRGPGRRRPVGVYGADIPARSGSMVPALDRLLELTPGDAGIKAAVDAIHPTAVQVSAAWWRPAIQKYEALPADAKTALTAGVKRLVDRVPPANAWAHRLALVVQQNEEFLRLGAFHPTAPRDIAMAANTLWVLGRLKRGERAVYWAHNAHVQRAPIEGPAVPPGSFPGSGNHFADALGSGYYAIATTYGGPSMDDKTTATAGSVDGLLERVGKGSFLLPLRGGGSWLAEKRLMRFQVKYLLVPLGEAFDAVAYFERAVPADRRRPGR